MERAFCKYSYFIHPLPFSSFLMALFFWGHPFFFFLFSYLSFQFFPARAGAWPGIRDRNRGGWEVCDWWGKEEKKTGGGALFFLFFFFHSLFLYLFLSFPSLISIMAAARFFCFFPFLAPPSWGFFIIM